MAGGWAAVIAALVLTVLVAVVFVSRARTLNSSATPGFAQSSPKPEEIKTDGNDTQTVVYESHDFGVQSVSESEIDSLLHPVTNPDLQSRLLRYKGFDVGFNPIMHVPNWVAWELTGDEVRGTIGRHGSFEADPRVEGSAEKWDYNYSGYDRGHMAPAGDMKWDSIAMQNSFYMTNMCPQAKELNTGAWKNLEEKCRNWAIADSAIIIITGPVLTDSITDRIGDTGVAVPHRFFKVVLAPFADPVRGIGFVMPNSKVRGGLQGSAVSIDEVERITGHNFFAALPDSIEDAVEAECDFPYWSRHSSKNKRWK